MTGVQILDEAVCISNGTNTLGKGMNPTILPLAMGRLGSLIFVWQLVLMEIDDDLSQSTMIKIH